MSSLTIRNLNEQLKGRLRVRAALRGRSMEEEARQILRAALDEAEAPAADLAGRIRRRFAKLGDVRLPIAAREPVREPALADEEAVTPTPRVAARKPKRRA